MKKITMLSLAMLLVAATAFAQMPDKGMVEFTMSGPLFQNQSESEVSTIGPAFGFGYFMTPAIEVGGGLQVLKFGGDGGKAFFGDKFSLAIDVNGKYHFAAKEKMWPYVGAHVNIGLGDGPLGKAGGKDAPLTFGGAVGVKYWPMEGGALFGELAFDKTSPKALKETTIGVNLGILIRLK
ncbi:hypothetical protein K1X84_05235 [bacterium]|nr:hypothetical protein [bacterium]